MIDFQACHHLLVAGSALPGLLVFCSCCIVATTVALAHAKAYVCVQRHIQRRMESRAPQAAEEAAKEPAAAAPATFALARPDRERALELYLRQHGFVVITTAAHGAAPPTPALSQQHGTGVFQHLPAAEDDSEPGKVEGTEGQRMMLAPGMVEQLAAQAFQLQVYPRSHEAMRAAASFHAWSPARG